MTPAIRWVVGASLIMACAMGIGRFAYTPLLPLMAVEFGWDFAAAGDVASANFLGYMVGALIAPRLATSVHVRSWLAISLMASVLTTYLGAEATTFVHWLVVRFLSGVASAFCLVIMTTVLIFELATLKQEKLGNVHFSGVGFGILLCMAAVYQVGSSAEHWARLASMAALMMALAWALISKGHWQVTQPALEKSERKGLPAGLPPLIAGYGFFGFGYVVAATFIVAMAENLNVADFRSEDVWLVVGLAIIPSVYIWQALANRFGLRLVLRIAYITEAVGMLVAGVAQSVAGLMFASVVLGATFAVITALGLSAARVAAPHRVAFAVSSMTVAFALGQLLGPAISGRMADYFGGFLWPCVLAAALLFVAGLLVPMRTSVRTPAG